MDGHDQLYENAAGEQVFRTQYQAEILASLDMPLGARVLDFGAGKATTLQRFSELRPDIDGHVFDVSSDYVDHWNTWVHPGNQATYTLPEEWMGRFEFITAHFVLEHVAAPVEILKSLARVLAPGGRIFFSVPNVETNTGDLLVVDHLSHFTRPSLERFLARAGLLAERIDEDLFNGAFVVVARLGDSQPVTQPKPSHLTDVLVRWQTVLDNLATRELEGPVAIYGAGFYGSVIATCLVGQATVFLDQNPYLQGSTHLDLPVVHPDACPIEVRTVVVGLNPARAREIIGEGVPWLPEGAELLFLDTLA
ncbi:MAG: class I SAM-dependent methyltransferase [Hyphomicrobiales bacterium]